MQPPNSSHERLPSSRTKISKQTRKDITELDPKFRTKTHYLPHQSGFLFSEQPALKLKDRKLPAALRISTNLSPIRIQEEDSSPSPLNVLKFNLLSDSKKVVLIDHPRAQRIRNPQ